MQFAPGEWDPEPLAESVTELIQYNYELEEVEPFWTPVWVEHGDFREHLHGYKLYLTVADSMLTSTVITDRKRKFDATDTTGWKIYAEGFVADAILEHDTTLGRNPVDVKYMKALMNRDLTPKRDAS